MSNIRIHNLIFDYYDQGKGDVLLFLHGLGSSKHDWEFQIPYFSKKYRTIVPDLRGHGNTEIPSEYGINFMTSDIVELLKVLQIKKVTVIGFSMGGAIAFELAAGYPELVTKIVIVNSGPDFNNMGNIGEELLHNRTLYLKEKGLIPLAKDLAFNMFPEDHQIQLRNAFEERCKKNDFNAYHNSFITLMDWGLGNRIKDILIPVLIVASDMDYTPISFKEAYLKKLKNATLKVIHNSRHGVIMDQPDEFNKILNSFLND